MEEPRGWVNADMTYTTASPTDVQRIIGGPFHLKRGCLADAGFTTYQHQYEGKKFNVYCGICNHGDDDYEGAATAQDLHRHRLSVLRELQRLARNGTTLRRTVTLEKPTYWTEVDEPTSTKGGVTL